MCRLQGNIYQNKIVNSLLWYSSLVFSFGLISRMYRASRVSKKATLLEVLWSISTSENLARRLAQASKCFLTAHSFSSYVRQIGYGCVGRSDQHSSQFISIIIYFLRFTSYLYRCLSMPLQVTTPVPAIDQFLSIFFDFGPATSSEQVPYNRPR